MSSTARFSAVLYRDPATFRSLCEAHLMEREAENNLILGVLNYLSSPTGAARGRTPFFFRLLDESEFTVGVALLNLPNRLLLTRAPTAALEALAERIFEQDLKLPGVLGPEPAAREFAEIWAQRSPAFFRPGLRHKIYELTELVPAPPAAGKLRLAMTSDTELLVNWCLGFTAEAGVDRGDERETIERLIRAGNLFVWEVDGEAAAMAASSGRTPSGARVSLVYTPKEKRGRGYASSGVSELTARLLGSGMSRCFLYTDATNPVSNRLYQRLGYREICDANVYEFSEVRR